MKRELSKVYNPKEVEDKWYKYWEENKLFHAEIDKNKKPYTIVIPPPNITGSLTLGHVLNNTLQDIFIRWKRMQGFNACWVPGTDHASIATETKVTDSLLKKGIEKKKIGREEFLKYCHEWKELYGGLIIKQLRKLGVSCDWDRLRFTMDKEYYQLVIDSFVHLYKKGLIYRGVRMVNWCPATQSAISDEEVVRKEIKGNLWYFKYPVKDSSEFITVATTRPETMLGDTGVAVNSADKRYSHLIGKKVVLPIVQREIPIFADDYVDMTFGTGAVKVTPAHDVNDYEMSLRHNLEFVNIFNKDASLNENVPEEFRGLDRYVARKLVVEKIKELGLLEKIEDYTYYVGYSQRADVPIEPYLSEQWFMKMEELAKPAIKSVQDGEIKFYPDRWVKTYFHWMENIRDWCISRQLWWGHRIPVWYHKETNEIYCDSTPPADIENWRQDDDVLDTWASSWLWAHGVFKTKEELEYFYPTDTLITAPDIIFFWVARMIIAGHEFVGKIPFRNVYFTSLIRDELGRKMSKTLGNSPDPLEVIDEYSADALRFTIIYLAPLGQDIRFKTSYCELGRNFANKIWNAARFLMLNAEENIVNKNLIFKYQDFSDKWIFSKLNKAVKDFNSALDNFNINDAAKIIYNFIWSDFCDWYIEFIKTRINSESNSEIKSAIVSRAFYIFENILKMIHPIMPFISEELWHSIEQRKDGESISISSFPVVDENMINDKIEKNTDIIQSLIVSVRNIRNEMNVPLNKLCDIHIKTDDDDLINLINEATPYIKKLAKIENILIGKDITRPKLSSNAVIKNLELFIPLAELIDIEVEKTRLQKEADRLIKLIDGVKKKLDNQNFISRAPEDVILKEKEKLENFSNSLEKIKNSLSLLE